MWNRLAEIPMREPRMARNSMTSEARRASSPATNARARAGLAQLLERPVHLFLNVKERAGWDEENARLRAIGLEDPS